MIDVLSEMSLKPLSCSFESIFFFFWGGGGFLKILLFEIHFGVEEAPKLYRKHKTYIRTAPVLRYVLVRILYLYS